MEHAISVTLLLFALTAIAEEAPDTVFIKFENERQPTADAGVGPGMDVVRDGSYLYMLQERHLVIHDFNALEPFGLKNLTTYRPEGQVYAAIEHRGYVYVACGSAGIHVLDKKLTPLKEHPTAGFAMDVQVCGEKLYAAQGADGLVCYNIDGPMLETVTSYQASQAIKQVRVTPNGRYTVVHVGGSAYEIVDVADGSPDQTCEA